MEPSPLAAAFPSALRKAPILLPSKALIVLPRKARRQTIEKGQRTCVDTPSLPVPSLPVMGVLATQPLMLRSS
jgi:hypothetical protein